MEQWNSYTFPKELVYTRTNRFMRTNVECTSPDNSTQLHTCIIRASEPVGRSASILSTGLVKEVEDQTSANASSDGRHPVLYLDEQK